MNGFVDLPGDHQALDTIQDWLAELTYKPGVSFMADFDYAGDIVIRVAGTLFDSYAYEGVLVRLEDTRDERGRYIGSVRGPVVKIGTTWVVPGILSEHRDDFHRWLRSQIIEWEIHEAEEWLRLKGVVDPIFDPHRTEKITTRLFKEASGILNDVK
jgi:hypothetical protein